MKGFSRENIPFSEHHQERRKSNSIRESVGQELDKKIPSTLTSFCFLVASRRSSTKKRPKLIESVQPKAELKRVGSS